MLKDVELPDFGEPTVEPTLGRTIYEARIEEARRRASASGLDVLAVYADREHSANIAYLTGLRRRTFMNDELGIRLKPEVLPFSNIPAYLPPFLLSPTRVMAVQRH